MKILLINVSLRPDARVVFPPMGLGYIALALDNAGYKFDLLDTDLLRMSMQDIENRLQDGRYDVVLLGCIVTGYRIVKQIIAAVRKFNSSAKIIVGNTVASSIPHHLLTHTGADFAVIGEGDQTTVELLQLLEAGDGFEKCAGIFYKDACGNIRQTSARPPVKDLDSISMINWNLFDIDRYISESPAAAEDSIPLAKKDIRLLPLCSARGCVHRCTFCYHSFKNVPYRRRSNANLISEIEARMKDYGVNVFYMQDDLTFFSKRNIAEFVQMVEERGLEFYWRATCCANLFDSDGDIELAKAMKKNGCVSMGFSLESADRDILKAMNKHHTPEQFLKQAELFHKAGIVPLTSLVVGYPQETQQSIKATIDCCIKARIYPSIGFLLPQPGSKMFDYALENGYIGDMEKYLMLLGDRQDLRLNMTKMSDEILQQTVLEQMQRCSDALKMGLSAEHLIKTGKYQKSRV